MMFHSVCFCCCYFFFCSAEENLNRIIRFSTPTNIVRIQYELFQELKRNGNDRSLRIALNLFGHHAHMIKQRKIKPYALNLLPCILSISQRKEQQLIETLSAFLLKFCKYFQISLTENEVSNLIEVWNRCHYWLFEMNRPMVIVWYFLFPLHTVFCQRCNYNGMCSETALFSIKCDDINRTRTTLRCHGQTCSHTLFR